MKSYSKRISLKGALLFSLLLSYTKNCMHNKCWAYSEILPKNNRPKAVSKDHTCSATVLLHLPGYNLALSFQRLLQGKSFTGRHITLMGITAGNSR